MTKKLIQSLFAAGQTVTVTNHYITKADHPCFGTQKRVVKRVTSSHLHFEETGNVPWPKAEALRVQVEPGWSVVRVQFFDFPKPDDLFLTIAIERPTNAVHHP